MSTIFKEAGTGKLSLVFTLEEGISSVADGRRADSRAMHLLCPHCRIVLFGNGLAVVKQSKPTKFSNVNDKDFGESS